MGPALNGVARRENSRVDRGTDPAPQSHFPETMMPPLDLAPRDMERLVAYLLSLPYIKPFSVALAEEVEVPRKRFGKPKL